ncbi:hypothetical protein PLESTB_000797600 [Pleodorina starrii]|uniref:Uncharacterized protein n=1 Tax=Pleodorina starrii TaxID=330485 RepID=A0A9W6BLC2_9CHLO|nr:hypothetical protein PLESTM_000631400 [Pleodorina starrii]GLC53860.1 hypothetical protein PLESTB_000797600 [Pleodorina starrii]GLC75451.1 hypothetical protein PLESTF_001638200 [Pleodorina starrii]
MHASKERNVSIVFRQQNANKQHCAGVEALLMPSIPDHKILFTASRDSTVKRWDVSGPAPVLEASFEGHADWVNDLALIGDLLVTCSNDQTVRLWRAGSDNGQLLHTLSAHSDYVTRLAAAPDSRVVVSAGLRGEVFSYELEGGRNTRFQLRSCSGCEAEDPAEAHDEPCSVYALALSPSARLLAAGTSESLVRLMDPRTGRGVCKLRGHRDVVRCLAVNSCGTKLLSGASDGAIKLWDVGMRRCVQTFQVHTDSVWSLLSTDDSLSYVYSAGRDRALFRTNTQTCTSELLALEEGPVRALAVDPDARPAPSGGFTSGRVGLWAATECSHVNMWLVPAPGRHLHEAASLPATRPSTGSGDAASLTTATTVPEPAPDATATGTAAAAAAAVALLAGVRPTGAAALQSGRSFPALNVTPAAMVSRAEPIVRKPVATIPGIPGIVAHEVLADRRRVLTRDARGTVALWDVLTGMQMAVYGKVDFDAKRRELWEARSVPPWFTADHRLGCLSITLAPTSAFTAEEYAVKLGGYPGELPEEHKVNYGKLVLECVFAKWRFMLGQGPTGGEHCCISPGGSSDSGRSGSSRGMLLTGGARCSSGGGASGGGGGGGSGLAPSSVLPRHRHGRPNSCDSDGRGGSRGAEQQYYYDLWPKYWQCDTPPAVICTRADGQRWRRLLTSFDGSEAELYEVPTWVGDVVLRSASVAPLEAKITFFLLPAKGSNLPTLPITRLQAPHILEAHKVARYTSDKLKEHDIRLETLPGSLRPRVPLAPLECTGPTRPTAPACRLLELTCNGMAVPYDMNLAAIKKFLCRPGDDLVFHYGVRDPDRPAPAPLLGPSG